MRRSPPQRLEGKLGILGVQSHLGSLGGSRQVVAYSDSNFWSLNTFIPTDSKS